MFTDICIIHTMQSWAVHDEDPLYYMHHPAVNFGIEKNASMYTTICFIVL